MNLSTIMDAFGVMAQPAVKDRVVGAFKAAAQPMKDTWNLIPNGAEIALNWWGEQDQKFREANPRQAKMMDILDLFTMAMPGPAGVFGMVESAWPKAFRAIRTAKGEVLQHPPARNHLDIAKHHGIPAEDILDTGFVTEGKYRKGPEIPVGQASPRVRAMPDDTRSYTRSYQDVDQEGAAAAIERLRSGPGPEGDPSRFQSYLEEPRGTAHDSNLEAMDRQTMRITPEEIAMREPARQYPPSQNSILRRAYERTDQAYAEQQQLADAMDRQTMRINSEADAVWQLQHPNESPMRSGLDPAARRLAEQRAYVAAHPEITFTPPGRSTLSQEQRANANLRENTGPSQAEVDSAVRSILGGPSRTDAEIDRLTYGPAGPPADPRFSNATVDVEGNRLAAERFVLRREADRAASAYPRDSAEAQQAYDRVMNGPALTSLPPSTEENIRRIIEESGSTEDASNFLFGPPRPRPRR